MKKQIFMDKSTYLNLSEVKDFIKWLNTILNSNSLDSFVHCYDIEPRGRSKSVKQWQCSSLFHAYEQYEWQFSYTDFDSGKRITGSSYSANEAALNDLQEKLKKAVDSQDNNACLNACLMIVQWGGVLGSEKKGNNKILLEMHEYLAEYLEKVRNYFNGNCELSSNYQLHLERGRTDLVMNAGFTKIYSLLCNNFIIYDSRVGSALGLLVVKYLESNSEIKYKNVPDGLDFYYGKARNNKVNRNPSTNSYKFKALYASYPLHIRNNLKANWIIGALSLEKSNGFSEQKKNFRKFESALFMIGYRI